MPASNLPYGGWPKQMTDLFLMPHTSIKLRRLCANPLCKKGLSNLNKQALCFGCYDQALLKRCARRSFGTSSTARWKTL